MGQLGDGRSFGKGSAPLQPIVAPNYWRRAMKRRMFLKSQGREGPLANETENNPLTLLTFAPMVDSELSRLVLAHHRVAYRERDHLLPRAAALTFFHGGYGRVPLLYGQGLRLTSPRTIAEHFERTATPEAKLIPAHPVLAARVEADWQRYNGQLAFDTAVFAYHHLLPLRALMSTIFAIPLDPDEAKSVPSAYGEQAALLSALLRPTRERGGRGPRRRDHIRPR